LAPESLAQEYWQQEVNYVMDVTLENDLRTVTGTIDIQYINNSPDTLFELYLKTFPNAVQRGSYADYKRRLYNDYSLARLEPEQEARLQLFQREGAPVMYRAFDVDNTIATVLLAEPLPPEGVLELSFDFVTILPDPAELRMGLDSGVIKAAYWYPQVCVYDRKFGWVNAQYLGWGECYGDYGRFDVTITAPADQIVAATGVCVNEEEVLPPALQEKLHISNYIGKTESVWPDPGLDAHDTKTWHYVAENVNDFVWTASNRFCLDADTIMGVKVVAYPLRHRAKKWQYAVSIGKQSIETYSELIYPYQWPVIRICDAYSGMEYPMLTNCGGGSPSPYFNLLLYHEIGHQWFMGQVGSNAIDRPFLDEGFTTLLEHVAMERYLGRVGNINLPKNWYERTFAPLDEDRMRRGFRPLLLLMKQGLDRPIIYTSYDQGIEYWPYRVSAYYKTVAMHYSLRSILGDSAYFDALHKYFDEWVFRHPYEDDFTRSMEAATGIEFDNYLDQWYYSRDRLDYAFSGHQSKKLDRTYEHTIRLERKGDFVAPVDVAVIWEQGDTTFYTVAPEGMNFAKPGYVLLPTWHQFRRPEPRYEFTVKAARSIEKIVVDPHNLLMDIDRLNNASGIIPPVEVRLENLIYDRTPVNKYALRWRPDLWYDDPNGVQAGLHLHGSYLETENRFSLDARMGTRSGEPFVDFTWSNPFTPFGSFSTTDQRFLWTAKRTFYRFGYEKQFRKWYERPDRELFRLDIAYSNLQGDQPTRLDPLPSNVVKYLPDPTWDATHTVHARLTVGFLRTFRYGSWYFLDCQSIGGYEEYDFSADDNRQRAFYENQFFLGIDLSNTHRTWLSLVLEYLSTTGDPPSQYVNHLSRAKSIDRYVHAPVFRFPGTFPTDWEDDFYVTNGRVRGYQDRVIYLRDFAGWSLELTPPDVLPYGWLSVVPLVGNWLGKADQLVFVDGGRASFDKKEDLYPAPIRNNEPEDGSFYLSAGLSVSFPPIRGKNHIRLDFPLYLSEPLPGNNEFDFRFSVAWILPSLLE
jgi:hypothetical protein